MGQFPKMKQVSGLLAALATKAADNDVLKKNNNLSDLQNPGSARSNLGVYSQGEVDAMVTGATQARVMNTITELENATDLKELERIFVHDNGDGKWAIHLVVETTDGSYANSTVQKIADQDVFENALSAQAVKSSYESNANTNAFTDSAKTKVDRISISQVIDLDALKALAESNEIAAGNAQTAANNAQTAADSAQTAANNAHARADEAYTLAGTKKQEFTELSEVFTGLTADSSQPLELNVNTSIAPGFDVQVFINGIYAKPSFAANTQTVTITAPYHIEASDEIIVIYKTHE